MIHAQRFSVVPKKSPYAFLGLTGVETDPHPKLQVRLRLHRSCDRTSRGFEHRAHAIARVLEHTTPRRLDPTPQHDIMGRECGLHPGRVFLPPLRGGFDIGEQERHGPTRTDPHVTQRTGESPRLLRRSQARRVSGG